MFSNSNYKKNHLAKTVVFGFLCFGSQKLSIKPVFLKKLVLQAASMMGLKVDYYLRLKFSQ